MYYIEDVKHLNTCSVEHLNTCSVEHLNTCNMRRRIEDKDELALFYFS